MTTPIIDEEDIKHLLSAPVTSDYVGQLQAGAVKAMIDMYDRKVTRDEFIAAVSPCIALYGSTSKMAILANVQLVYESGDLNKERFDQANEGLAKMARAQSEKVIEIVTRLQQCPTDQDKLH